MYRKPFSGTPEKHSVSGALATDCLQNKLYRNSVPRTGPQGVTVPYRRFLISGRYGTPQCGSKCFGELTRQDWCCDPYRPRRDMAGDGAPVAERMAWCRCGSRSDHPITAGWVRVRGVWVCRVCLTGTSSKTSGKTSKWPTAHMNGFAWLGTARRWQPGPTMKTSQKEG